MMTPECYILAIGPYSYGISDCLDYTADRYKTVPIGSTVTSCLAEVSGPQKVRYLMAAVGATMSPETWVIDPNLINFNRLLEVDDIDLDEIEALKVLLDAGFKFQLMLDW